MNINIPLPSSIALFAVQAYLLMHCPFHPLASLTIGCIAGWTIRGQFDGYRLKKLGH